MAIHPLDIIEELSRRGLFRERDLKARNISHSWLETAQHRFHLTRHGHGVWSHLKYTPTRYELLQVRFPKAVFWGPSALWLLGAEAHEPEALWIAIANKSRAPRTLGLDTVIIRTRHLEDDVVSLCPEGRLLKLRLYSRERAEADIARTDPYQLLARAADREQFELVPDSRFLFAGLPSPPRWNPVPPCGSADLILPPREAPRLEAGPAWHSRTVPRSRDPARGDWYST